jgi:chromosome segregation ATPase
VKQHHKPGSPPPSAKTGGMADEMRQIRQDMEKQLADLKQQIQQAQQESLKTLQESIQTTMKAQGNESLQRLQAQEDDALRQVKQSMEAAESGNEENVANIGKTLAANSAGQAPASASYNANTGEPAPYDAGRIAVENSEKSVEQAMKSAMSSVEAAEKALSGLHATPAPAAAH